MKTKTSIINHPLSGRFYTALLCTTMAIAPFAVQAGGGGRSGGGEGGFGRSGGGFGKSEGGFGREGNFGGVQRASQVPREPVRGVQMNAAHRAQLQQRFDRLSERSLRGGGTTEEVRIKRDRIYKTRDYLFGLEDVGWPVDLIDTWSDALAQDEILVGMPTELVLDYWGNPVTTESVVIAGGPAQIWSYRVRPDRVMKVTVFGNKVTAVRRA